MSLFPQILTDEKVNERHIDFRNALFELDQNTIGPEHIQTLMKLYGATKQIDYRNKILKLLYDHKAPELKAFFEAAYKKERFLDMKIYALRGLAQFAEEKEIEKLVSKLKAVLAKREETTPYNYQEYELLRGKNALPFLVQQYHYASLKELMEQADKQYERMPEAFKGHFTTDEKGEIINLRTAGESSKLIAAFFAQQKM
ncbi:hypothetical protein [Chryseobacterium pennipullorum]|uniref:HEAT repeat domain-containing protein n=1 Tax=Chryseobacterium pennipullorum TaxID=2258963 RepID=A0A3D9B1I1_9FLAO|nr:hypothetical protein [Chryseobacterium pennipullorum]REC47433.1 hypothetical protein DRF67_10325 [Chryseobacterium pennipullorum]